MPRQARLDAPGTLHHIIILRIEQRKIVDDRKDRENDENSYFAELVRYIHNYR